MSQLITGTAARATKAALGRTGSAIGTAFAENKTKDAQRGLAHNETGSTHNKRVARATETVVHTARNLCLHAPRRCRRLLQSRL